MNDAPLTNPDITGLIKKIKSHIFNTINCVQIGRIKSYIDTEATASIQIMVKRKFTDKVLSYPLLVRCPVFFLYGGSAEVYMPISVGDDCLVLFSDRNIDNWFVDGVEEVPANSRTHDLSDGIAIVGIRSLTIPPATRNSGEAGIANDEVRVALNSNKANIENASKSLLGIMEGFLDLLKTITITDPISGALPVSAASITDLENYKADFQALLFED